MQSYIKNTIHKPISIKNLTIREFLHKVLRSVTNTKDGKMRLRHESVTDSQEENKPPQRRKNKV